MALSKVINLGDLKQQLEIQRVTKVVDEYGFAKEEVVTIAKVRCKVEFDDRLMREFFKNDGVDTTQTKIFVIRYIPDLNVTDKILFKNSQYEIYGFNNVNEDNRFLKIWARTIC